MVRSGTGCCSPGDDNDESIYESYQSVLQTIMTVAALEMGFVITGALISIGYDSDQTVSQKDVQKFVQIAFRSFIWCFLALTVSLCLSVVGAHIHGLANLRQYSASFLKNCFLLILFSELCLYQCFRDVLGMVGHYIDLDYALPSEELCPGHDWISSHRVNSFCALVGQDLYDSAQQICGAPRPDKPRALPRFSDPPLLKESGLWTEMICSQLDWYENETVGFPSIVRHVRFGYDLPLHVDRISKAPDIRWIENNAKILGDTKCGVDDLQNTMTHICKHDSQSQSCSSATLAYLKASNCADDAYDDTLRCQRACGWTHTPDLFTGHVDRTKPQTSIYKGYNHVRVWVDGTRTAILVFMLFRPVLSFCLLWMSCMVTARKLNVCDDDHDDDDVESSIGYLEMATAD